MDAQTTQLRQQITQTRAAMAATLDLLERRVSQKVAATVEQAVIGPVRSVQAMMARDTIVLQQAPWLIMAVGGLLGYAIGGWVADLVGLGRVFELTWNILRWPAIVCLLVVATALVYYFAPDVEQEWKWITPGSACAVLGWLLASLGFAFYVNHFGSYNATYGSIGAVIVLLTWMYVSGLLLLVGGEINAEIEHAAPSGKDPGEKQLSTP
jgi:YihY family inner membrane protein